MAIPSCFCAVFHLNAMWWGVYSYLIYIRSSDLDLWFQFSCCQSRTGMRGLFILICHLWYMNPFCYYQKHIIMNDWRTWLYCLQRRRFYFKRVPVKSHKNLYWTVALRAFFNFICLFFNKNTEWSYVRP